MSQRIAVIGAGMAGLACASRLESAGLSVVVLDKGRTIGGRLATRASGGFAFDHGAPALEAERAPFQSFLRDLGEAGAVVEAGAFGFPARFIGVPSMNQLLAPIAAPLDIRQNAEVIGLVEGADGWTIAIRDREPLIGFDVVVLAIPAPQAAHLLGDVAADLVGELGAVAYRPVMSAMVALAAPLALETPVTAFCDGPVASAIRNDVRPERPAHAEQWVLHAGPDWSRANVDTERDDIADRLFAGFGQALRRDDLEATLLRGHRWRYALVERPLGSPCVYDPVRRIGLAGDYCRGPSAEHAFESGIVLAERINA